MDVIDGISAALGRATSWAEGLGPQWRDVPTHVVFFGALFCTALLMWHVWGGLPWSKAALLGSCTMSRWVGGWRGWAGRLCLGAAGGACPAGDEKPPSTGQRKGMGKSRPRKFAQRGEEPQGTRPRPTPCTPPAPRQLSLAALLHHWLQGARGGPGISPGHDKYQGPGAICHAGAGMRDGSGGRGPRGV